MISFTIPGAPRGKQRARAAVIKAICKATDDQLTQAYLASQNVWAVAALFGMCGQSVHERLTKLGAINPRRTFTDADVQRLRDEYRTAAASGKLAVLAAEMGRTRQFLCRQARALGLTERSRPRPWSTGEHLAQYVTSGAHPRGMLGKHHTDEARAKMSAGQCARNDSWERKRERSLKMLKTKAARGTYATARISASWKAGWREIGGQRSYYRSRWEANYARYLQWLQDRSIIVGWEHEPEVFWFLEIKRGTRSYLPDFRITELSGEVTYHEVKGWMDDRSRTKIKRMRIYHPRVKLIVIDKTQYTSIASKVSRLIPGWEGDQRDLYLSRGRGLLV